MFSVLKERKLLVDAFWALAGQLASALALLLGTRILTEMVAPDIYGQVALLNGFVALGVSVFSYPFICAGMRILPECLHKRERAELYRVVAGLAARATVLAASLLALAGAAYASMARGPVWPFVLAGLLLAATVRRELGIQLLIGERRHREASLWQTTDSILRPLLAILLVWRAGASAVWVLSGYILASTAASSVWSTIHAANPGGHTWQGAFSPRNLRRDIWAYAAPLIPMELVLWANGLGDRYVIGYMLTAADVGLYSAGYVLINEAFNRSAMVLLRVFQPAYFQCFPGNLEQGRKILWTWLGCVLALGLAGASALLLTKNWVAALLLAKSYQSAASIMPAIGIGCALHALGTVAAQPLLAAKKTRLLLLGRLSGAAAAAIGIPLLVSYQGLPGAAMANPLYFGVETLALALLAKPWKLPVSSDKSAPLQAKTAHCRVSA